MDFYKALSPFYDEMINFEERLKKERNVFKEFIVSNKIKSAIDIGCGTGFYAILLSELRVESWGIDDSAEMIKIARINAEKRKVNVKFKRLKFENWHLEIKSMFDSVLCLGNSLPHILEKSKLKSVIKNIYNRISNNGIFVAQILNYERIMKNKERIVNIKKINKHILIRFYDFYRNYIVFNILIISEENEKIGHEIISTKLRPIYKEELITFIRNSGFRKINIYSDFQRNRYYKNKSKDLFVFAVK